MFISERIIMSKTLRLSGQGFRPYDIVINNDYSLLLENLRVVAGPDTKICIITDTNVGPLHGDELLHLLLSEYSSVSLYSIEAGETNKNLDTVSDIYANLISLGFNRHDLLIALGGGVVGDITGFAAATYMRGIDFVQIPTTLLSQVDSSVGGKTGVDYCSYKNMVGAFYQPRLVYINTTLLSTLPERELSAGMGEVVKYGLIYDEDFFNYLSGKAPDVFKLDYETMEHIIYRSCDIKRDVVSQDPTEKGLRAILNFGHTFGHAIEKLMDFRLLHGECVSVGMVIAAFISKERKGISDVDLKKIKDTLSSYHLPITFNNLSNDDIMQIARHDKKSFSAGIRFVLLEKMGKAVIDTSVKDVEYAAALDNTRG
ncbi:MAG: 3-dehydroquinate synthase [Lachnospiraceae bacterium]|nr:3-dehydroquinate synthase [Lachnospiraceae bacterium]